MGSDVRIRFRLFFCRRCGELVCICSRCDRRHRYCSKKCSSEARDENVRESKRRYRNTDDARETQKYRQRRFRASQGPAVTEQSSAGLGSCETLDVPNKGGAKGKGTTSDQSGQAKPHADSRSSGSTREDQGPASHAWQPLRCAFCGRICGIWKDAKPAEETRSWSMVLQQRLGTGRDGKLRHRNAQSKGDPSAGSGGLAFEPGNRK